MLLAAEPAPLFTPPLLPEVGCVHVCVGSKAPPPFSISFIHLMKSESPCWYQCLEEGWNLHDLDLGLCRAGLISLCSSSWLQAGRTAQLRQCGNPQAHELSLLLCFVIRLVFWTHHHSSSRKLESSRLQAGNVFSPRELG